MLLRFLVSGGINTMTTYGVFLILLRFVPHYMSYSISFIIGIGISYLLNRYFVFASPGRKRALLYPAIYLMQYLFGLLIVFLWIDLLQFNINLVLLASLIVTIPITFILTKWIFQAKPKA